MRDKTQKISGSLIQHGNLSDRVYIMRLNPERVSETIRKVIELRGNKGYSKIFAKVPNLFKKVFLDSGFKEEAWIPGPPDYGGKILFLSKFYSAERGTPSEEDLLDRVLRVSLKKKEKAHISRPPDYSQKELIPSDAGEAAEIYKTVFKTYPFPIHDPSYISESMSEGIRYFGISKKRKLIALSSAEPEELLKVSEMSDFAVISEERGNNLSLLLLDIMNKKMKNCGIKYGFTIARSLSYGMNAAFAGSGYNYSGRLINNTNIGGALESMNVWWKKL